MLPDHLKKLYPFQARYMDLDCGRMHYLDEGEGAAVIMVHGNPTWSFFYRNLVLAFRDGFRCIVPDHIGCGLSDKPQSYNYCLQNHVENLIHLVKKLDLESFHLVVHDWGGAIGMALAEHFPERIRKIQILNTAAFRSRRIPLRINVCRIPILGEVWIRGFNGFAAAAVSMAVQKPLSATVKQGFLFPYDNWHNRIATHRFVMDIPLAEGHPSYERLSKIERDLKKLKKCPMQIIWGGKDFCFNDHFLKKWQELFPEAKVHYFAEAGHYVLEDCEDASIRLIQDFFN